MEWDKDIEREKQLEIQIKRLTQRDNDAKRQKNLYGVDDTERQTEKERGRQINGEREEGREKDTQRETL